MLSPVSALCAVLVPLLPAPSNLPAPGTAHPVAEHLAFAWPAAGEVEVTEQRLERGKPTALTYRLSWTTDAGTGNLVLRTSEVKVTMLRGLSAEGDEPHIYAVVGGVALGAVPTVHLGPDGKFLAAVDADRAIQAAMRAAEKLKDRNKERQKQLESQRRRVLFDLKRPNLPEELAAAEAEKWRAWTECWIGFDPTATEPTKTVTGTLDGILVTELLECRGREVKDGVDRVDLRWVREETGEGFRAAVRALLQARQVRPPAVEVLQSATHRRTIEGTLDAATLRPLVVEVVDTLDVIATDRPDPLVVEERRTYGFTWPTARAAGADGEGD